MERLFEATNHPPFPQAGKEEWETFERRRNRSGNHKRIRARYHRLQYLSAACLILLIGFFGYLQWTSPDIYATGIGENQIIHLDDGSSITMYPNSRIEIEHGYENTHRSVLLIGQANFKVAKGKHPFVVTSSQSEVEAIGTEFTLFDYPDISYFSVAVQEGIIEVRTDSTLRLREGSVLESIQGTLEVEKLAVYTKTVSMVGTPNEIALLLEKHFQLSIELDPSFMPELYRFSMDPQKQLSSVETLAELVQGKLHKTENGYSIIP